MNTSIFRNFGLGLALAVVFLAALVWCEKSYDPCDTLKDCTVCVQTSLPIGDDVADCVWCIDGNFCRSKSSRCGRFIEHKRPGDCPASGGTPVDEPAEPPSSSSKWWKSSKIALIVIGSVVGLIVIVLVVLFIARRRHASGGGYEALAE